MFQKQSCCAPMLRHSRPEHRQLDNEIALRSNHFTTTSNSHCNNKNFPLFKNSPSLVPAKVVKLPRWAVIIGPQRTKLAPISFQWFLLANLIARWAACLKKSNAASYRAKFWDGHEFSSEQSSGGHVMEPSSRDHKAASMFLTNREWRARGPRAAIKRRRLSYGRRVERCCRVAVKSLSSVSGV